MMARIEFEFEIARFEQKRCDLLLHLLFLVRFPVVTVHPSGRENNWIWIDNAPTSGRESNWIWILKVSPVTEGPCHTRLG